MKKNKKDKNKQTQEILLKKEKKKKPVKQNIAIKNQNPLRVASCSAKSRLAH